jgi:hypothetical protein
MKTKETSLQLNTFNRFTTWININFLHIKQKLKSFLL